MIIKKASALLGATLLLASCQTNEITHISSTNDTHWQQQTTIVGELAPEALTLSIDTKQTKQTIDGFGACFNELGWHSLSRLTKEERKGIMQELFQPGIGANFSICRMPLGANDFSLDWYSYNETDGDFEMKNFSIDNDRKTLIPFIHSAQEINPELKVWASPWSPPQWMKYNGHYAARYNGNDPRPEVRNGLSIDQQSPEGEDLFIQTPEYFKAYAKYFGLFVDAYRKENINIFGVMPQNEFNSDQVFPSCPWRAKGLATFIGHYLGPEMEQRGVDVMFGTMERPNHLLVDTILTDPKAGPYIKAVGFQWAGKKAIAAIHRQYPRMPLYQTEQECGDGKNDWKGTLHSWSLMKHYFDNGVSTYQYWNISLDKGGVSRWGWAQNSLIVVDPTDNTFRYSNEYYLLKHLSHFVPKGSKYLSLAGDSDNALAFLRPDEKIVIMIVEQEGINRTINLTIDNKAHSLTIAANSINTFCI